MTGEFDAARKTGEPRPRIAGAPCEDVADRKLARTSEARAVSDESLMDAQETRVFGEMSDAQFGEPAPQGRGSIGHEIPQPVAEHCFGISQSTRLDEGGHE